MMEQKGISRVLLILLALAGGTLIWVFLLRSREPVVPQMPASVPVQTLSSVIFEGMPERPVRVHIAATNEAREKGLSGSAPLAPDEGMLFFFEYPGKMAFWMKDMRFSIDIIWISSEWIIVDITHDLAPETYPRTVSPRTDAQYVLEVPSGFAKAHQLKIGQSVQFKK